MDGNFGRFPADNSYFHATIRYGLPKVERVTLKIYNLLSAEVVTLVDNEQKAAGYHAVVWDGQDRAGRNATSGVYFIRFRAGNFVQTRKMLLIEWVRAPSFRLWICKINKRADAVGFITKAAKIGLLWLA